MTVNDLMTPDPVTVPPHATVAEAWDLMRELEIRHVPVVEHGALVGMVSDRDLARVGIEALRGELGTPVLKVMTSDVIAVNPESDLSEVVDLLVEHKIGAIPVVLSDTRQVVGIVSYIDVLRALQDSLAQE